MVDLVYGRGITDIVRESSIFKKFVGISYFIQSQHCNGSADIINVCNLHCSHCYWWLNRKEDNQDLSVEDWRATIRKTFKKQNLFLSSWREPTMRPEIIDVFCEEMPRRICVVTNGYFPLKRIKNLYFYWISLDGTEKAHDAIRGKGSYVKTKNNILEYIKGPPRNGKPSWKYLDLNDYQYGHLLYSY